MNYKLLADVETKMTHTVLSIENDIIVRLCKAKDPSFSVLLNNSGDIHRKSVYCRQELNSFHTAERKSSSASKQASFAFFSIHHFSTKS